MKMHDRLAGMIIADGETLEIEKLKQLAIGKTVMVLDGAYQIVKASGIKIDYLLGDFDSLDNTHLVMAKTQGITVVHTPDQSYTDLDKGIQYFDQLGVPAISICCATGQRLDHTLHNVRLLNRYYSESREITIHTALEKICLIKDKVCQYDGKQGDGFALLGAPKCVMTTQGLQYDMRNQTLSYGGFNSVCNSLENDVVILDVKGSVLMIHQNI